MRLSEALELFLLSRTLRPRTVQTYQYHVQQISNFFKIDVDLDLLTLKQLALFRDSVLSRCSPVTYNTTRRHLIAIANFAIEADKTKKNPFKLIRPAPEQKGPPRRMSKEVVQKIIHDIEMGSGTHSSVRGHWAEPRWYWLCVFKLFYYTGMRRRQLAGLRWEDIDFHRNTLRMAYHSSKTDREWEIPLPAQCKQDLQYLHEMSLKWYSGLKTKDRVFVLARFVDSRFAKSSTIKASEFQISAFFRRVQKHTGTNISAHKVRHTTASELMNKTNNPKLVQTLLGHTNLSTTMLYVHPDMDEMKNLVSQL